MNTFKRTSIAILSADTLQHPLAVLAQAISVDDNGWQQLLPAGHFSAVDGRPNDVPGGQWYLDGTIAQHLIEQAQLAANDLVIDYEHQTLYSEQNGQPAPAAGWFKAMEWREGSGLWIKPRWTDRARDFIHGGEYRYLSAVFPYDKEGHPLALHSAALVNRPGIDGLQAVAALNAHFSPTVHPEQETVMNETLRKLLAALGIELAEDAEPTDEQYQTAVTALKALTDGANKAAALETEMATLKAKPGDVSLNDYVPRATYDGIVTELAALKAGSDKETATRLIDDARAEGKVLAAEADYLTRFANQQGLAALKALIAARPAVAALKGQQTTTETPPKPKDNELSAEDMAVCKAMGLDVETFKKAKAQETA